MVSSTIDHMIAITVFLAATLLFIGLFNQTIQTAVIYQRHRATATKASDLLDNMLLSPYPEGEYPAGQWDYQYFYQESFDKACKGFEANVRNVVKALFRKGKPDAVGKPSPTASVRKSGGWFGGGACPDLPRDTDVITEEDLENYTAALEHNGFFGPDSWYMNQKANADYAKTSQNGGRLSMPVLFLHGAYDTTCETMTSRLAEPMRRDCADLTEVVVNSGHWMAPVLPGYCPAG